MLKIAVEIKQHIKFEDYIKRAHEKMRCVCKYVPCLHLKSCSVCLCFNFILFLVLSFSVLI